MNDPITDVIMTDFELALLKALGDEFPSANVDGCLFHFCQAVTRWAFEHGLKCEYVKVIRDARVHCTVRFVFGYGDS